MQICMSIHESEIKCNSVGCVLDQQGGHPSPPSVGRMSSSALNILTIHAPRMGSDLPACSVYTPDPVSIHAPRMGSDNDGGRSRGTIEVSIHAPRMGSDGAQTTRTGSLPLFQSTLPAWGATRALPDRCRDPLEFQSTLPAWGATAVAGVSNRGWLVSIHAPRMGSDLVRADAIELCTRFNPRSPHGERPPHPGGSCVGAMFQSTLPAWGATSYSVPVVARGLFQSTLPAWGATISRIGRQPPNHVSIHAPRMGSDRTAGASGLPAPGFNPRSPHGERRYNAVPCFDGVRFQSTLPAWGATYPPLYQTPNSSCFNPRSPHGERRFATRYK